MSNTPIQEPPAQELSSGSGQTSPSRPFQPISDPSASKRVCFYKSGDPKFSGHRMVISARTFKTFDALLDALSKKVPLPFGVRTITTPRGTHLVKALDDLLDGGSYVCSDQKRVKPLNLDEVNRRQVPWNTTRPVSAGRRKRQGLRFGRRNEVTNRPAKVTERVAVRTPKKLVVIKNRDPTVKRTIVLQRRTAPTFEALLDYLSQILQFPVLKLFSTDGRRVDSLTTLILCAGVVVAAGNEPFRLGNYSFHRTGQMAQLMYADNVEPSMVQPTAQNSKSFSSGRGSRNFSLSSERYIVDQINKSRNGTMNSHLHHNNGSFETEVNHRHNPMETCGTGRVDNDMHACIVPKDDDIEKSFRVNQDGSMTVEMKVRLTIKEEEMLHWTTTLSRSSLSKRTLCASISETGNSSPDSNNAIAKDSSSTSEDESKEENHPADTGKVVGFNDKRVYEGYTSTALATTTGFKRTPTPGPAPRHVRKKASVESVKMVTESGVKERTLGHYSYLERTADGETTEGYCVVRHSSSSSNKPIPKPRKTVSAGASNKGSHSSIRSPGVAEVLQIQNNGMEVTETVMHIYESQGCYDNYFANEEYSADGGAPESKPSTDSGPQSSSNDCDIDFSRQPPTTESRQRQKEEMLSLSSEPITSTHELINNRSSVTENEAQTATNSQEKVKKDKSLRSENKKKIIKPARNEKSSTSTSGSDKKQKESIVSPSKKSRHSSKDKLSSTSTVGKKDLSSSDSAKSGQKSRGAEKHEIKKTSKDENMARKEQALLVKTENVTPPNRQNINKAAAKDNGHNVNTPTGRPQMKKNMLDILQPKKALLPGKKTISKPKSMTESILSSPKRTLELGESFSMPSLNPSPSEIHQYVENWLEKVNPDPVPYTEEAITDESEPRPKVVFQIGGDSESDEKNECQTNLDEYYPTSGGGVKKSASCLSVPLCHAETGTALLHNEQYVRGLCVSMPSVRVDPVDQENRLRSHKSAEAIAPADNEPSPSMSNILSPTATIKPVLRQLCSSIQCIRGASDTNTTSNLEKSSSLPDFPTQVASVFGSSCKALVSFLSVMTLRDNLTGAALGEGNQSRSDSEAMLMMESLQKISAIEDEEEQRASLTDLQSRASSRFRERWKDFQILRERLESEPLSPKVSETEFALDVFSEGGETFEDQQFCIDELMEELNMPQDLRAEISSTIQQAKSFYPVEESTFVEAERNQSDSEEDVEKFVEEYNDEAKQSSEPDTPCIDEDITQTKQGDDNGEIDNVKKMQSVYSGQATQSELSGTERDEPLKDKEEEQVEEVEDDREDGDTKEVDDDDDDDYDEKTETGEREEKAEEKAVKEEKMDDKGQGVWEAGNGSGEEEESVENAGQGTEEVMTVDEEEEGVILEEGEKEAVEETEEGLMDEEDQEAREDNSFEETDERDGVDETEEEGRGEEGETEEKQRDEIKYEADEVIVETDEGGEVENIEGVEEEEEADASTEDAEEAEEGIEVIEENNEEEEMNEVFEEKDEVEIMIEEEKDEVESRIEEEKDEVESRIEEEKDEVESMIEEEKDEVEIMIEEEKDEVESRIEEEKDEVESMIEEEKDEVESRIEEEKDEVESRIEEEKDEVEIMIEEEKDEVESMIEEEEDEVESMIEEEEDEVESMIEEEKDEVESRIEEEKDEVESMIEEEEDEVESMIEEEKDEVESLIEEEKDEVESMIEEEKDEVESLIEEEKDEVESLIEEEKDETGVVTQKDVEEVIEDEEEEDEEEMVDVIEEEDEEEDVEEKDKEEDKTEVVSEENQEEEEEREQKEEQEHEEDGEDVEVKSIERKVITVEEGDETDMNIVDEEKCGEVELEKTENSFEEESGEEKEVLEEAEDNAGQMQDEEEREDDEEENERNELNEGLDQVEKQESNDEAEEENVSDVDSVAGGTDCKSLLEEASYMQQLSSCEGEANVDIKVAEYNTESPTKYSSEGLCEDDKGNGTDTVNEIETDEVGELGEERSSSLPHAVEISQELLDFVNLALQSSSLIFTYDAKGNIRIEPDNARVVQTKQIAIPKSRADTSYGLKCLPSPSTSDLSDYRPETSESGGYKTQESVDIVTESGEEASGRPSPVCRSKTDIPNGRTNVERLSVASNSEILQNSRLKSGGSFSSYDSGTKASKEDLSYFSAASSQKADAEPATEVMQCISFPSEKDSTDGVLIDQGRWLLKENHLIRKSPPVSLGMYGSVDSTSIDTGQENSSVDSLPHHNTQYNPLAAISSSELEEMAKPQTPKCTYYSMPHGSDSDPFLGDSSVNSSKKDTSSVKGRGFRVSPKIDTSKSWENKNGSLSSFASVEFKIPDRKVHPEGESSAVTQARRTSSGERSVLQAQDSLDTLRVRCGQYCPIL